MLFNVNRAIGKVLQGHGPKADLEISVVLVRATFNKRRDLGRAKGKIPFAGHQVTEAFPVLAQAYEVGVVRTVWGATEGCVNIKMILQVLPYSWGIQNFGN
ncbi:hypothetical protein D3C80_1357420 [compost metagenome]